LQVSQAIVTLGGMKRPFRSGFFLFLFLAGPFAAILAGSGCNRSRKEGPSVRILGYSSIGAKGGFLPSVQERFLKESGCSLQIENTLGATQMIAVLTDPKLRRDIDVVMGVDEVLYGRLKAEWVSGESSIPGIREKMVPLVADRVRPGWIPLDYGALAFIYRRSAFAGVPLPKKLRDLLQPAFRKKFILQDPRASSPGLMFFLFAKDFIRSAELRPQWLTLAPSWDSSYQMFLSGDAPMVWSYLSSLAYHASKGEGAEYAAVDFEEGAPLQVEGMGIVKQGKSNPCVRKWIDFMLNPETVSLLAEKQWMWPALKGARLPKFFDAIPQPGKAAKMDLGGDALDRLLLNFAKEIQGAGP
jgi:thiamine transport system substrate-binding protein